jgi:hypothetical protein
MALIDELRELAATNQLLPGQVPTNNETNVLLAALIYWLDLHMSSKLPPENLREIMLGDTIPRHLS